MHFFILLTWSLAQRDHQLINSFRNISTCELISPLLYKTQANEISPYHQHFIHIQLYS